MLTLSKQTDYALLALTALVRREREAAEGGGRAKYVAMPAKEIAEQHDIPIEFLAKVLQKLAKAHMVTSTFGPTGGYKLALPASEIRVGEVIDIIDGGLALAQCMRLVDNDCDQSTRCTIRGPLTRINEEIFRVLNTLTIDEITEPVRPEELVQISLTAARRPARVAEETPVGML
jgi:Rrf2 family protein